MQMAYLRGGDGLDHCGDCTQPFLTEVLRTRGGGGGGPTQKEGGSSLFNESPLSDWHQKKENSHPELGVRVGPGFVIEIAGT